jgi:hypothetical protein
MTPPGDIDRLSEAELKRLVLKLLAEAAELRSTVAAQRDEIARLKGGPGRPAIKPSGMEQATERKPTAAAEKRPQGGKTRRLAIDEERVVACAVPPCGSRFKGHRTFVVQDLMIRPHVVRFRRERWMRPDGTMVTAPLPAGIDGHFGPGCAASCWRNTIKGRSRCRASWRCCGRWASSSPSGNWFGC